MAEISRAVTDIWKKFRAQPAVMQGLEVLGAAAVALELDKTLQPHIEQLLHQTHVAWADALSRNNGKPLTISQIGDVIKSGLTGKGPYSTLERRSSVPVTSAPMTPLQPTEYSALPPQPSRSSTPSQRALDYTGPLRSPAALPNSSLQHGPDVGNPAHVAQLRTGRSATVSPESGQVTPTSDTTPDKPWWQRTYSLSDHVTGIKQVSDSFNSWHDEHVAQPLKDTFGAIRELHTRRSPINPDGPLTRAVTYVLTPYPSDADFQPSRAANWYTNWQARRRQSVNASPEQVPATTVTIIRPDRRTP